MSITSTDQLVREQEGFIAKFPLPARDIHKNLSLRDALRLAAYWGCKIKLSGKNDAIISHHLVQEGRTSIPVSTHRNDTSQALVSFLRKVKEETTSHPDYLRSIPQDDTRSIPPATSRLQILTGQTTSNGVSSAAPALTPLQAAIPKPPKPEGPRHKDWAGYCHEAGHTLVALAGHLHYRHHCTDASYVPLSQCDSEVCKKAQEALERIRFVGDAMEELATSYDILKADYQALKTAPVVTSTIHVEPARAAQPAAPVHPVNKVTRIRGLHSSLMEDMGKVWGGGFQVHTRLGVALRMLAEKLAYSDDLLRAYEELDFGMFKDELQAFKKSQDSVQFLLGLRGYGQFVEALTKVRQNRAAKR